MIECLNHAGSFDCTPFCDACEGGQEIESDTFDPAALTDGELLDVVYDLVSRDMSDAAKVRQIAQLLEVMKTH